MSQLSIDEMDVDESDTYVSASRHQANMNARSYTSHVGLAGKHHHLCEGSRSSVEKAVWKAINAAPQRAGGADQQTTADSQPAPSSATLDEAFGCAHNVQPPAESQSNAADQSETLIFPNPLKVGLHKEQNTEEVESKLLEHVAKATAMSNSTTPPDPSAVEKASAGAAETDPRSSATSQGPGKKIAGTNTSSNSEPPQTRDGSSRQSRPPTGARFIPIQALSSTRSSTHIAKPDSGADHVASKDPNLSNEVATPGPSTDKESASAIGQNLPATRAHDTNDKRKSKNKSSRRKKWKEVDQVEGFEPAKLETKK